MAAIIDPNTLEVRNNESAHRFETMLGDEMGVIEYRKHGAIYDLTHTGVPEEYNGQGIAGQMAKVAMETIRAEGAQLIPSCPYIQTYIKRHPEYNVLVADVSQG